MPITLLNASANRFVGWARVNTDLAVANAFGQKNGVTFVRGATTGLNTRVVDLLVDLDPGETLVLPNWTPDTTTPPAVPTVPPNFFGGNPALNGVAMTQVSTATDGQATVEEWRVRIGVWQVTMWTRWYPGEPWVHAEVAVTHSSFSSALVTATWPDYLMTWGNGSLTILGRSAAPGSIVANGTQFGDGQARAFPVLWAFPLRIRDAQDVPNFNALAVWGVIGHGVETMHPDGTPYVTPTATTWGAANLTGAVGRLHSWTESPNGITSVSGNTGPQADQVWVRFEPSTDVAATLTVYVEAFRWAGRPCHHLEANGDMLEAAAHPNLRLYEGRPFDWDGASNGVAVTLGKPFDAITSGNCIATANGWYGPDLEHWLANGLAAAVRYTGSPCLQWLLRHQAVLYMMSRWPDVPTYGSTSNVLSTRDLIWEPILVIHIWRELKDRTKATEVRDRFFARCVGVGGPILPWISTGTYGDIWDVRTQAGSSVPVVPGWIPWQQAGACWSLDYAVRTFSPTLDALIPHIAAGAQRCLEDCFIYEDLNGVLRWVEYERQSIVFNPTTSRWERDQYSRSGLGFDITWFVPLWPYILRYDSAEPTANEVWAQLLQDAASSNDTKRWFPPNTLGDPEPPKIPGETIIYSSLRAGSPKFGQPKYPPMTFAKAKANPGAVNWLRRLGVR